MLIDSRQLDKYEQEYEYASTQYNSNVRSFWERMANVCNNF